jgi:hypothetical protein
VQANESANKKFLIAHRLLDDMGFKNNSLLESVLSSSNQVSCLVHKQSGMGLNVGYQMAKVLKEKATSMRLMVVSGTTPDGDWKEAHTRTLPSMFKMQRSIFAQKLESRFQVDGSPDKNTLLALKLDPSVNTIVEDGNFSSRTAAQQLMMGEYRRRLMRRHKLMFMAANVMVSYAKYASILGSVLANKEPFMDAGIFDLGLFWVGQKSVIPLHYSLLLAEVGCEKVASANVEVVFSGAAVSV